MKIRPTDSSGDILPVLSSSDLLCGAPAVARLAESRLTLFSGDWWENPALGNDILRLLRDGRPSVADAQALSTYLSSYVRATPGVLDVRDEAWSLNGSRFSWSCTAVTDSGTAEIRFDT